eukprot:TRINITY_DN20329_c0_g1_i1.p1 TRINITY_DN20329_c0_g1~~TRINITY_DN20329_c0_g1_i1.p1  ORF type:complete len:174 (+),score=9.80 TRINITY_DN20329_c0_g1_i1:130-651(+)
MAESINHHNVNQQSNFADDNSKKQYPLQYVVLIIRNTQVSPGLSKRNGPEHVYLHTNKTDVMLMGIKQHVSSVNINSIKLDGNPSLFPAQSRNLVLSLTTHYPCSNSSAITICQSCYYQFRSTSYIREYYFTNVTSKPVPSLTLSHLHNCNSLFSRLPGSSIYSFQCIHNYAA